MIVPLGQNEQYEAAGCAPQTCPQYYGYCISLCMQIVEHALSTACNLAAGSQPVKQQLCDAGIIQPVIYLLSVCEDRMLAQLAALVLRNLSRNPKCRAEIVRLDGVSVLLDFLSLGVEDLKYPLLCEVCCHPVKPS